MLLEGQGSLRERWVAEMGGPAAAAFAACGLILLQDTPLDMANFYTAEIQAFGMFTFDGVPKKTFYAFKAFREMLDAPLRAETTGAVSGQLALLSGLNPKQNQAKILISKFLFPEDRLTVRTRNLPWPGPTRIEVLAVDSARNLETIQTKEDSAGLCEISLDKTKPAVLLLRLNPVKAP
jgi:hypothetical protein